MVKRNPDTLSRRERQIMDVLFQMSEASAADVQKEMDDAPSYTAVRTHLRILEEKGQVTHREEGRRYIYRPKGSPKKAGRGALSRVLNVFFGGSLENALAAHLGDSKNKLSKNEIGRLRKIIDDAEKENSND